MKHADWMRHADCPICGVVDSVYYLDSDTPMNCDDHPTHIAYTRCNPSSKGCKRNWCAECWDEAVEQANMVGISPYMIGAPSTPDLSPCTCTLLTIHQNDAPLNPNGQCTICGGV